MILLACCSVLVAARESAWTRSLWETRRWWEEEDKDDTIEAYPSQAREAIETTLAERSFHGTTTVAFCFQGGIACAVDSRASLGAYVGSSRTEKVIPFSKHVLGTMAGSAADCSHFIRLVSANAKLHELEEGEPMTTEAAARLLARGLRRQPSGLGLSVGSMVMGVDGGAPHLYYVDSDGARVKGTLFAVGSGSTFAYSVLDAHYRWDLDVATALDVVERAVRTAVRRDAYSGGMINVYLVDAATSSWSRVRRIDSDQE